MRVLILSTFGTSGGAAVASTRLKLALEKYGINAELRVLFDEDKDHSKLIRDTSLWFKFKRLFLFSLERIDVFRVISKGKYLYRYSTGNYGLDISKHPEVKNADVIHLHWVNFSFLSIKGIAKIAREKPVVWTLHDMWAFTGGCHYSMECYNYQNDCNSCFYLRRGSNKSHQVWNRKKKLWNQIDFQFITCSNWLKELSAKSSLLKGKWITAIGNAIDTDIFKPLSKDLIRSNHQQKNEDFYVLVGAMDLSDERKGFDYFLSALDIVYSDFPNLHLLTFGKGGSDLTVYQHTHFGRIGNSQDLVKVYNMADIFVLPSIQDNLPNTVMEAMSCGVPVVAFDCGGVSDMIDHLENGYLARNRDVSDMANGIRYFADERNRESSGKKARLKIINTFGEKIIAEKHIAVYRELIHHYYNEKG